MKPEIGMKAKDVVTGFEGVVTGVVDYLTGCRQLLLTPAAKMDGTVQDARWIDEDRCEAVSKKRIELPRHEADGCDIPATVK